LTIFDCRFFPGGPSARFSIANPKS
jgi:hypothetical protein